VCDYEDKLPCFGGGHDLSICDNCFTKKNSYSKWGHTYERPKKDICPDLAGSYYFYVDDMEIY
jgi:hypothetical protein